MLNRYVQHMIVLTIVTLTASSLRVEQLNYIMCITIITNTIITIAIGSSSSSSSSSRYIYIYIYIYVYVYMYTCIYIYIYISKLRLRVEQLKKLQHEVLVDKALGDLWVDVVGDLYVCVCAKV